MITASRRSNRLDAPQKQDSSAYLMRPKLPQRLKAAADSGASVPLRPAHRLHVTNTERLSIISWSDLNDSDSVYWTCSQKAKNQKAKQTIMHCATTIQYKTRNEMQCNAMAKRYRPIGILGGRECAMNVRFVAVSTVTGSRIRDCFLPRCM